MSHEALTVPGSSATAPHGSSGCTCAATIAAGASAASGSRSCSRAGGVGLLARLEHREQRRGQLLPERVRRAGQRDERGHVDVVAAGVHRLRSGIGAERNARALGDRQPVELRAHGHGGALRGADAGDQPRARDCSHATGSSAATAAEVSCSACASSGWACNRWRSSTARGSSRSMRGEQPRERPRQCVERVSRSRHSGGTTPRCPSPPSPRPRSA